MRRRDLLMIALLGLTPALSLYAQGNTALVQGRITTVGAVAPVEGATVELTGTEDHRSLLTSSSGEFRFGRIASGRYAITVRRLGYLPYETTLFIRRDTTLVIALEPVAIGLDTLAVEAGNFTLHGEVRDRTSRLPLIDVDAVVPPNHSATTNGLGRFKVASLPTRSAVAVSLTALAYLPAAAVVMADRDTTVDFLMAPDSVALRMMSGQLGRLDQRSRGRRSTSTPAITRAELMKSLNFTVWEVVQKRFRGRTSRIKCVIIDERESTNGLAELAVMLPDRVERIEFIEINRERMIRIYTRDFIGRRMGSDQPFGMIMMYPICL